MQSAEPKFDIAISFLVEDISLAQAMYNELSKGLEVFFFPHNQEELAGTEGLESMQEPFLHQSRINLVLYREKWGNTPWTRVEATAIKESCLDRGWDGLFFFMVDPASAPPKWLPRTHVRFNYGDFSLEQAVGAIKLRVQEQGGKIAPMTPLKRAELLKADELYRHDQSNLRSLQGIEIIHRKVIGLFAEIEKQCAEVNMQGHIEIEYETTGDQACILRHESVGMIIRWHQRYSNSLDDSGLTIDEYNGRLIFNRELGRVMQLRRPDCIRNTIYEPELSRSRELGWKESGSSTTFLSTRTLAEKCVLQLMDLIERAANRDLENPYSS